MAETYTIDTTYIHTSTQAQTQTPPTYTHTHTYRTHTQTHTPHSSPALTHTHTHTHTHTLITPRIETPGAQGTSLLTPGLSSRPQCVCVPENERGPMSDIQGLPSALLPICQRVL